jgi:hypothetical protein
LLDSLEVSWIREVFMDFVKIFPEGYFFHLGYLWLILG